MFLKILFNFSVLLVVWCVSSARSESMKLELIQVIFRHGARTPSENEAKHVNVNDSKIYEPEGFYQLTNEGKRQVYDLGVALREKYDSFLGKYKAEDVYALSSNYTRTKMSLQLLLAGLYAPIPKDKWNLNLNWNPIAFGHTTTKLDILLAPHQSPKFEELRIKTIAASDDYQKLISKYKDYFKFMTEKTGIQFEENVLYHAGWTYYATKIHKMMNLPIPDWCTDDILKFTEELFKIALDTMSWTEKLKTLNGGTLIRKVLENIKENNESSKPKKIYLYSTHDLTLAGFTRAQNISTFDIPPFGSAIIVEKYRDDQNEEHIKMLSWDGTNFNTLQIGNYQNTCPLNAYTDIVKDVIPTDEDLNFLKDVCDIEIL